MNSDVRRNHERRRYELLVDEHLVGVATYRISGDVIELPHTVIAEPQRGNGLGEILVKAALDDIRPSGMRVLPSCWYVAQFIDEHPEYRDLLANQL